MTLDKMSSFSPSETLAYKRAISDKVLTYSLHGTAQKLLDRQETKSKGYFML